MSNEETQAQESDVGKAKVDSPVGTLINRYDESVQAAAFGFFYGTQGGKDAKKELERRKPKSYDPEKPPISDTDSIQKGAYSEGYQHCLNQIEEICLNRPAIGENSQYMDPSID